jgi:hypothetical protein
MMMCAASAAFALACGVDAEQQIVLSSGSELATERSIPSGWRGEEERNQTIPVFAAGEYLTNLRAPRAGEPGIT